MTKHYDPRRLLAIAALSLVSGLGCIADENAEMIATLDEIDRSIAESRQVADRSADTLEDLRKDLYKSAVQTRDAKRLSRSAEEALERGDDVSAELLTLQKDILDAGSILRDVNNNMKKYLVVSRKLKERIDGLESEIDSLKEALVKGSGQGVVASERVALLQSDLAKANELVDQRGRVIERLNRRISELKEAGGITDDDFVSPMAAIDDPDMEKGKERLDQGRFEEAVVLFNKVINRYPDSNEARLGLASCYFEMGQPELSERMIEEVLSRDKANPRALGLMGTLHYHEGKLKKARKTLEKAVRYDENNAYNQNFLGVVLYESGKQEDGIDHVRRAVALDPGYISAHYNFAVMLASADEPDLDTARVHYGKALELGSPRDPVLDRLLGVSDADSGEGADR